MVFKKLLISFIMISLIFPSVCLADDFLEESELDVFAPVSTDAKKASKEPSTNSKNIIAIDRKSLSILYEKNAYKEVPMASTTKIMTAIIVLEKCDLSETVEISKNAANIRGSTLGITSGAKVTMNDLLYGLMLRSGNDCGIAIAEHVAGSVEGFAELMNQKAQELNLTHTHFVTPHGLDDDEHYTTAYELALLTDYALKNKQFCKIVGTKQTTIHVNGYPRTISNTNELLGNLNGVYGVKTGFTFEAGRCLVSSCKRNGMDIIVVVLGADTKNHRTQDSIKIINYIYDNFEYVNISDYIQKSFEEYKNYYEPNVSLYKTTSVPNIELSELDNYDFPIKKNTSNSLNTKFYTLNMLSSDVKSGNKIGCMNVGYENKILCSIDIVLKNDLQKNSWGYYFVKILQEFKNSFAF